MKSPPKVLLIETPYGPQLREPIGLAYIAGALREKGIDVSILCDSKKARVHDQRLLSQARGCHVVGFSATTPSFPETARMARQIKTANPETFVVLGGYHSTMLHETVLEKHPEFDAMVRGEGERSFIELIGMLQGLSSPSDPIPGISHRHENRIIAGPGRPPIADLDALAPPARDLIPPPGDFPRFFDPVAKRPVVKANVSSSRGCPYRCAFCSIIKFYGDNRIRHRGVDKVLDEIELLVTQYGVECIHFCDDNFLVSKKRALSIAQGMVERGLKAAIRFNARSDQILRAEEHLPALAECGLREVELGIENGSQPALDRYAKGLKVETNVKALQVLEKHGIRVDVDYILFDPHTTLAEIEENLEFLKQHIPWGYPTHKIIFTKLDLYPGTEAYDQAVASGLYSGDPDGFPEFLFRNDDIAEIYALLTECRKEAATYETGLEGLNNEILQLLEKGREEMGEQNERLYLTEFLFANGPFSRLALNLLDKIVALRKAHAGGSLPAGDFEKIKVDYVSSAGSYFGQLEDLAARLRG
ncbi:B12-binding domain-containing radical SAM protein [Acidobacteriota bacterium]